MFEQSVWRHIENTISQAVQHEFRLVTRSSIAGGDINQAFLVQGESAQYFVKLNDDSNYSMFQAEALGLKTIAESESIRVPQVICDGLCEGASFLVLEYLRLGGVGQTEILARKLADMHKVEHNRFGFVSDNFIGSTAQCNEFKDSWIEFFAEQRLGFQFDLLERKGAPASLLANGRKLTIELDKFFEGYSPKPSLVHGDLWQGNYGFTQETDPVIYDPACYYADHEVDLAMMELFGSPGAPFFTAYHRYYPIHSGYSKRKPLYNLYHILNHANLFGGGYAAQAEGIIERLLVV